MFNFRARFLASASEQCYGLSFLSGISSSVSCSTNAIMMLLLFVCSDFLIFFLVDSVCCFFEITFLVLLSVISLLHSKVGIEIRAHFLEDVPQCFSRQRLLKNINFFFERAKSINNSSTVSSIRDGKGAGGQKSCKGSWLKRSKRTR